MACVCGSGRLRHGQASTCRCVVVSNVIFWRSSYQWTRFRVQQAPAATVQRTENSPGHAQPSGCCCDQRNQWVYFIVIRMPYLEGRFFSSSAIKPTRFKQVEVVEFKSCCRGGVLADKAPRLYSIDPFKAFEATLNANLAACGHLLSNRV